MALTPASIQVLLYEIERRVWGAEYGLELEYLHVFIGRLRAKLEPDPKNPQYIKTISGIGYMLQD